jgi:hypothetical protein
MLTSEYVYLHYTWKLLEFPFLPRPFNAHLICSYKDALKKMFVLWKWDSAVGIATGYGRDGRGVGVRVPVEARFSPLHVIQTGPGAHAASYPKGTGSSFLGVEWPGREADH